MRCGDALRARQRQRLSAWNAMQHVEAGRTLYHSTLCDCCQHDASATQSVDDPQSTAASSASLAASSSRLQLTTESRSLPQHQHDNIPLDISMETVSVDFLKGQSYVIIAAALVF